MHEPPSILLTGFGPFPGVPLNASSALVQRLARAARRRFPSVTVTSLVLPTEWARAPAKVATAIARHTPDVAIHFGVSDKADGFVVERRAANICLDAMDGAGMMPPATLIDPGGPARRPATFPTQRIIARLRAAGLPAAVSDDAGQYLCNAVLYRSLAIGAGGRRPHRAGFIHIPASLAAAGGTPTPACPMTARQALAGGIEIIAACLED